MSIFSKKTETVDAQKQQPQGTSNPGPKNPGPENQAPKNQGPAQNQGSQQKQGLEDVTIVEFADSGERKQTVHLPKLVKSEAEWRQQLSPQEFNVTRQDGTEMAFTGRYWNNHEPGIYRCVCCGTALFDAATKFESGTGWPSFWQPIAEENVEQIEDTTFGMRRVAVACTRCDAHLGHVFNDGPRPTGQRYCMNSVSLNFVKKA
jgi:peptide-methionine (R)-S-oxide reductase